MKTMLAIIGVLAGTALGIGIGLWTTAVTTGPGGEEQKYGPWTTTTAVGETEQSPYSRARVAIYGIWGLPPSEAIYFSTREDSAGHPLDRRCTYVVRGSKLPARWWSVTLYKEGFYIDNPADRYSWTASDVTYDPPGDPSGQWTLTISPDGAGPNELAFGADDGVRTLLLRLYQPNAGVAENRGGVPLPTIAKESCAKS